MDAERYKGLKYPKWFETLSQRDIDCIANGCGPKGFDYLVPDKFRLIGCDFSPSCEIHDVLYYFCESKKIADNLFLENNLTIASRCFIPFRPLAEWFAFLYYLAVKNCGDAAYNRSYYDEDMAFRKKEYGTGKMLTSNP